MLLGHHGRCSPVFSAGIEEEVTAHYLLILRQRGHLKPEKDKNLFGDDFPPSLMRRERISEDFGFVDLSSESRSAGGRAFKKTEPGWSSPLGPERPAVLCAATEGSVIERS